MQKFTNTIIYVPSIILSWGIWMLLLMTQVVLLFPVCLQDLVDRVMTVLLSQQDQGTFHSYCFALLFFKHEK